MNAQTKIIAHRGFWKTSPETSQNSIESLKNAQKLKIYGSELDVQLTKDEKLIVFHDEHHGAMEISETNFSELKKLKLSNGEKIPSLKKYLKQAKKNSETKLIIELKPAKTKDLEKIIVEKALVLVKKFELENQVEFISFSLNICEEIKKNNSESIVQYLNGDLSPQELYKKGIDGFDYYYKILLEKQPTWISEAKNLGLITNSWTVNHPEDFKKLEKMGIDFLTTDLPTSIKNIKHP